MLTGMVTCPPRYRTTRRGPAGISATKQDELDHIDETALAFNAGPSSVDFKARSPAYFSLIPHSKAEGQADTTICL